jgi:hypothetical protein
VKPGVKDELRGYGKDIASEATKTLVGLFVDWVRTRPIKRLIEKRRAAKK